MLVLLIEAAVRSIVLAAVVWIGLRVWRVRNPHLELNAWTLVLAAAVALPFLVNWRVVQIPVPAALLGLTAPLEPSLPASATVHAAGPLASLVEERAVDWLAV